MFAIENEKVIAYLRILRKNVSYSEASIGRVLTSSNYRGTGIGKVAMIKAIDFIKNSLNENKIKISTQKYTIPFYEGVGFEVISDIYLEDNILHVKMVGVCS